MPRQVVSGSSRRKRRPTSNSSVNSQTKWNNLYGNTWEGMDETADDAMVASLVDAARQKQTGNINNMIGRGQISRADADTLLGDLENSLLNYQSTLNSAGRTSIGNFNDDQRTLLGTNYNTGKTPNFNGALDYLGGESFTNQKNDYINSTLNNALKSNSFDFSSNINNALLNSANSQSSDPMFSAVQASKNKKQNQSFSF